MTGKRIAFAGCGLIGAGLAANAVLAGLETVLYDVAGAGVVRGRLERILDDMAEYGACTVEQARAAKLRAVYADTLEEAVRGAAFVQESAPERLDIKQALYRTVQDTCGRGTVIGSSASDILPSLLQEGARYPERILVCHPFNPSHLLPTVEIVPGRQTGQDAVVFARELYDFMGKVTCVCLKEQNGYLVQGINHAIIDLAVKLVADGVGTAEDVDRALMYGPGMRLPIAGQLLTIALGAEGGWKAIANKYYGNDAPPAYLMVDEQVNEELANRPAEIGNDLESVLRYRDRALVEMLRTQRRL